MSKNSLRKWEPGLGLVVLALLAVDAMAQTSRTSSSSFGGGSSSVNSSFGNSGFGNSSFGNSGSGNSGFGTSGFSSSFGQGFQLNQGQGPSLFDNSTLGPTSAAGLLSGVNADSSPFRSAVTGNRNNRNFANLQGLSGLAGRNTVGSGIANNINRRNYPAGYRAIVRTDFAPPPLNTAVIASFRDQVQAVPSLTPFRNVNIQAESNGQVRLQGSVGSDRDRRLAAALLALEPGVRRVTNEIQVNPNNTPINLSR